MIFKVYSIDIIFKVNLAYFISISHLYSTTQLFVLLYYNIFKITPNNNIAHALECIK